MECPVCCETYTKRDRKKIECLYCNHKCCSQCVRTFIITNPRRPHCMKCNHEWQDEFVINNFTKKFVKTELREHTENHLFEGEKSRLDEAQVVLERQIEANELRDYVRKLEQALEDARMDYLHAERGIYSRVKTEERKKFTMHCPTDGCNSFLSSGWKCHVCNKKYCSKCFEEKLENHECKKESLETANLIKNDSKPCPNCGIFIHKLEGCDQMWCTECNTAFSWNSGKVINGTIHNPHFFEARRRIGRNPLDIPCGGVPRYSEIGGDPRTFPASLLSIVNDLQGWIEDKYTPREWQVNRDSMNARLSFLRKEINENEMKALLYKRYRQRSFNQQVSDLLTMTHTVVGDDLRSYVQNQIDLPRLAENTIRILNYTNETLEKICAKYNRTTQFVLFYQRYEGSRWTVGIVSSNIFKSIQEEKRKYTPNSLINGMQEFQEFRHLAKQNYV